MERLSVHGSMGYAGDWYGHVKRKCPVCKKVFFARTNWAYISGYKAAQKYYCSWSHLRQAQKEMEKKKKSPEKEGEEPKRKHGGGRPKTEFTPELEAEIYRRYKQGQRAAIVARELGINDHGIYTRYRKWKAEDKEQEET